jgi:hypothetical protein
MAPMRDPRWAMVLAGSLLLTACAAAADDVTLTSASAPAALEGSADVAGAAVIPIANADFSALASMSGAVGEDGALGDGCATPEGEALPDGMWFGYVTDYGTSSITVDVACVFGPQTEQYAAFATAATGDTAGYVVVNDVTDEHVVQLAGSTEVYLEEREWSPTDREAAAQALDPHLVDEYRGVWVCIEDGKAVAIVQPAASVPPVS